MLNELIYLPLINPQSTGDNIYCTIPEVILLLINLCWYLSTQLTKQNRSTSYASGPAELTARTRPHSVPTHLPGQTAGLDHAISITLESPPHHKRAGSISRPPVDQLTKTNVESTSLLPVPEQPSGRVLLPWVIKTERTQIPILGDDKPKQDIGRGVTLHTQRRLITKPKRSVDPQ